MELVLLCLLFTMPVIFLIEYNFIFWFGHVSKCTLRPCLTLDLKFFFYIVSDVISPTYPFLRIGYLAEPLCNDPRMEAKY